MNQNNHTLLEQYHLFLTSHQMVSDDAQLLALEKLQAVELDLATMQQQSWIQRTILGKKHQCKGLYLWGGVGRGKTFLMDLFFEYLPTERKKRLHFHRFMHWVHDQLKLTQGATNPLRKIAKRFADNVDIVCFDEFFVSDITDAMLLAGIFEVLFESGVVLVATSNVEPKNLYKNGLQRERFLPAIALIERYCEVHFIASTTDYRLRQLEQAMLYYCPCDKKALEKMESSFNRLAPEDGQTDISIDIEGRPIEAHRLAGDVAWFTFDALCNGPRSQVDYIELARLMHTVYLSHIPQLLPKDEDKARRFISLIDEFYERNVKLIVASDVKLHQLYAGERLVFEFERTLSRLTEMQSNAYLSKAHLP